MLDRRLLILMIIEIRRVRRMSGGFMDWFRVYIELFLVFVNVVT